MALEKLEGLYALDPLFASFLVHGDSTRSSLIAIAILDPQQTSNLVSKILNKNVPSDDLPSLEEAAKSKKVRKAVFKILGKTARQNKLNG